jgi:hypothetical protein
MTWYMQFRVPFDASVVTGAGKARFLTISNIGRE